MIIPKSRIYEACGTETIRPTLTAIHYNAERKRLEACDGFILAIVPVQNANGDPDMLLRPAVFKDAHKLARKRKGRVPVVNVDLVSNTVSGSGVAEDGSGAGSETGGAYPLGPECAPTISQYPDVQQIVPRTQTVRYLGTFDAALLYRLARAICEQDETLMVSLYQNEGDGASPFLVEPEEVSTFRGDWRSTNRDLPGEAEHKPDLSKAHGVMMPAKRGRNR